MTRIAVIDSGVDPHHPAVRGRATVIQGARFGPALGESDHDPDPLGHGTAVAATILRFGDDRPVELHSLAVFGREPVCDFGAVLAALAAAIALQPALINLSLGTTSLRHRGALQRLLQQARGSGCRVIAPASYGGLPADPGNLPEADAVVGDPNVLPMLPELRRSGERFVWFASPLPPPASDGTQRLLARGDSLAVAAVTGCLLRSLPR
jgi:subtilisin family serine protease